MLRRFPHSDKPYVLLAEEHCRITGTSIVLHPRKTARCLHQVMKRDIPAFVLLPEIHRRRCIEIQLPLFNKYPHQGIHHALGHRPTEVSGVAVESGGILFDKEISLIYNENSTGVSEVFASRIAKSVAYHLVEFFHFNPCDGWVG